MCCSIISFLTYITNIWKGLKSSHGEILHYKQGPGAFGRGHNVTLVNRPIWCVECVRVIDVTLCRNLMTSVSVCPKHILPIYFWYQVLLSSGADTWTGRLFSKKGEKLFGRGRAPLEVLGFYLDMQLLHVNPSAPLPLAAHVHATNVASAAFPRPREAAGGFTIHTLLQFSAPLLTFFCPHHPVFGVAVALTVKSQSFHCHTFIFDCASGNSDNTFYAQLVLIKNKATCSRECHKCTKHRTQRRDV